MLVALARFARRQTWLFRPLRFRQIIANCLAIRLYAEEGVRLTLLSDLLLFYCLRKLLAESKMC